jgi:Predicted transcriptional regulator containing an HTH domain and an uncharacterized domain shared with the mammalian protein Schlafen
VQNSGGLYGKVSKENFPNVSDYRNPFIAKAMKVLGYVNRFSRGIYRVQKELVENGNGEASFDFSLVTAFRVIENVSQRYFEEGFGTDTTQETSKKHPRNIQETSKKHPRNTQETPKNIQIEIIKAVKLNPTITRKELETLLERTLGSVKYHLAQLTKKGIIKHIGSTKAGEWIIIEDT